MYVLKICFIHPIFHDHFVVPSGMSCTDSGLSLTHLMFSSSGSGVYVGASLPPSCSFFSCSLFLHFPHSFPISLPCLHVYWMKSPITFQFSSVQFSRSVMSDFLWPHGLQHTRPPCLSPTPGVYSDSCPFSQWCYPTISSSVVPFSSCPQSFSASGSFPMSQFFESGGKSIGVSASTSILPTNTQDWSPLGWTAWISLQSKGLSRVFSNTTVQKHQFFGAQLSLQSNYHIHTWLLEKP